MASFEPGDVIMTRDGRRWFVDRMIESPPGAPIHRLLEVTEIGIFGGVDDPSLEEGEARDA